MPPTPPTQSHAIPPAAPIPQSHATPPAAPTPQSHATPPAPPVPQPEIRVHREELSKGFVTITVAGALVASIQGQLLSTTIGMTGTAENVAIRAVNAFWVGGLILDVLAALLAFLTGRWLERLTVQERKHLEKEFSYSNGDEDEDYDSERHSQDKKHDDESQPMHGQPQREHLWRTGDSQWLFYTWLGMSLFIPMPLLVFGIVCMIAGIYTYVWTQHSVIVASLVSLAGAIPLPFILGDFIIGKDGERRRKLITRLSEMQGDW